MPAPRKFIPEEIYAGPSTEARTPLEPESDVNVNRGVAWVVGGVLSGAVVALIWFIYRLVSPVQAGQELAGEISDYIVVPILGVLYAVIGAVSGGFLGLCVGIIFVAIAAAKASREAEDDEEESVESLVRPRLRTSRGHS